MESPNELKRLPKMAWEFPVPGQRYVVLDSTSPPAWVHGSRPADVPQSIADTVTSMTKLIVTAETIGPRLAPLTETIISFENGTRSESSRSRPPPTPLAVEVRLPSVATKVGNCKSDRNIGKLLDKPVTWKPAKMVSCESLLCDEALTISSKWVSAKPMNVGFLQEGRRSLASAYL